MSETNNHDSTASPESASTSNGMTRRKFLTITGSVAAGGGLALLGRDRIQSADAPPLVDSAAGPFTDLVPRTPDEVVLDGARQFFTASEAAVIEALTARIIPGDADDPGAREASVVTFIDRMLAAQDGWAEPAFTRPPYVQPVTGDGSMGLVNGFIQVNEDELERYGMQWSATPREIYRHTVHVIDVHATDHFGAPFAELDADDQDQIVALLADDEMPGFDYPGAGDVFDMIRDHTLQGMFSDPVYGGNRDLVAWQAIGYPGAQRSYSAAEVASEGTDRQPQGLSEMPHFAPGIGEHNPVRHHP